MTDEQRLKMEIADLILEVVDLEATRSDVQGVADATASLILTKVQLYQIKGGEL